MRRAALLLAALVLALTGCGAAPEEPASKRVATAAASLEPPATTLLERNGISLAVPLGWDGRVLFRDDDGASHVMFQVASFELPPNEGFEPPQELPPGKEDPIKAMGPGDVLIMITSDEPSGEPAPATISLADLHFLPAGAPRVSVGHELAQASFCRGEECFRIEVDVGERSPPPSLQESVNRVLSSLRTA